MNNKHFPDVYLSFEDLIGETIESIESIRPETGRIYRFYKLITCESGKRVLVGGDDPYEPNPTLSRMKQVDFFTEKEVKSKEEWVEAEKERTEKREREWKRSQLERLKKELGEVEVE